MMHSDEILLDWKPVADGSKYELKLLSINPKETNPVRTQLIDSYADPLKVGDIGLIYSGKHPTTEIKWAVKMPYADHFYELATILGIKNEPNRGKNFLVYGYKIGTRISELHSVSQFADFDLRRGDNILLEKDVLRYNLIHNISQALLQHNYQQHMAKKL